LFVGGSDYCRSRGSRSYRRRIAEVESNGRFIR
jgi:hypothetical protein